MAATCYGAAQEQSAVSTYSDAYCGVSAMNFLEVEAIAIEFAALKHRDQKYGTLPYIVHLAQVSSTISYYKNLPELRIAAWLHDSLEDTDASLEDLEAQVWRDCRSARVGSDRRG
jgi:(p)ppGpp synthase/HD superfamily hydrolase